MKSARYALLFFLVLSGGAAQEPSVYTGGIVNAASFAPAGTPGSAVAPGSLVSIFGTNLANVTMSADRTPLPPSLGGTSVTVDGIPAPLLYVSPGQINAQIPHTVRPANVPVVVTTAVGVSEPVQVKVTNSGLGLFTVDGSGCGRGAVQNIAADGTVSLNSPENSVDPDGIITVWGTGLTTVDSMPPDGEPAPSDPPAQSNTQPGAYLYDTATGVLWGGLAPFQVGVAQFNVPLRERIEGCAVPLRVALLGSMSQPVPVSIHRGGGACVDPPPNSYGLLTWTRSVTIGASTSSRETFAAEFPRAVNLRLPDYPAPIALQQWLLTPSEAPACAWTQPALLDAGTLLITAPGIFSQAVPRGTDGKYEVALPPGTIGPGLLSATSTGGADVGSFTTEIHAPDPITVTSLFSPDTQFGTDPVTVAWSGGSPDSLVEAAIYSNLLGVRWKLWAVVPASTGNVVFGSAPLGLPLPRDSSLEIVVRQFAAEPSSFQAAGLTLRGRHMVVYEVRFTGLRL